MFRLYLHKYKTHSCITDTNSQWTV